MHIVCVRTAVDKYEHFPIPDPVYVYIRQLENAVRDSKAKQNLAKLYPFLNQPITSNSTTREGEIT